MKIFQWLTSLWAANFKEGQTRNNFFFKIVSRSEETQESWTSAELVAFAMSSYQALSQSPMATADMQRGILLSTRGLWEAGVKNLSEREWATPKGTSLSVQSLVSSRCQDCVDGKVLIVTMDEFTEIVAEYKETLMTFRNAILKELTLLEGELATLPHLSPMQPLDIHSSPERLYYEDDNVSLIRKPRGG